MSDTCPVAGFHEYYLGVTANRDASLFDPVIEAPSPLSKDTDRHKEGLGQFSKKSEFPALFSRSFDFRKLPLPSVNQEGIGDSSHVARHAGAALFNDDLSNTHGRNGIGSVSSVKPSASNVDREEANFPQTTSVWDTTDLSESKKYASESKLETRNDKAYTTTFGRAETERAKSELPQLKPTQKLQAEAETMLELLLKQLFQLEYFDAAETIDECTDLLWNLCEGQNLPFQSTETSSGSKIRDPFTADSLSPESDRDSAMIAHNSIQDGASSEWESYSSGTESAVADKSKDEVSNEWVFYSSGTKSAIAMSDRSENQVSNESEHYSPGAEGNSETPVKCPSSTDNSSLPLHSRTSYSSENNLSVQDSLASSLLADFWRLSVSIPASPAAGSVTESKSASPTELTGAERGSQHSDADDDVQTKRLTLSVDTNTEPLTTGDDRALDLDQVKEQLQSPWKTFGYAEVEFRAGQDGLESKRVVRNFKLEDPADSMHCKIEIPKFENDEERIALERMDLLSPRAIHKELSSPGMRDWKIHRNGRMYWKDKPYIRKFTTYRLEALKEDLATIMLKKLIRPLTLRESGATRNQSTHKGLIYIYCDPREINTLKIGVTAKKTVGVRLDKWTKNCKHDTHLIYPMADSDFEIVPHVYRVEALVHTELGSNRVTETGCACGNNHIEWFKEHPSHARAVVLRWSNWMRKNPYHQDSNGIWQLTNTDTEILAALSCPTLRDEREFPKTPPRRPGLYSPKGKKSSSKSSQGRAVSAPSQLPMVSSLSFRGHSPGDL